MKCYQCIREFQRQKRKILDVKNAITIYDGQGLCAKHLTAMDEKVPTESIAGLLRRHQAGALSTQKGGLGMTGGFLQWNPFTRYW